jgi:hypothetical protein
MESLVPTPLTTAIQHKGASAVLQDEVLLRQNTARQFREAAYAVTNQGDPATGLRFLDEENRRFGNSDQTHGDRGVLLMANRQIVAAQKEFSQALALRPEDHQANLFANKDGTVRFRLRAFPNAEHVAIAGSFNNYSKDSLLLQRRGDEWVGEVHLAPGAYAYQVFVDGTWQMDPETACWPNRDNGGSHRSSCGTSQPSLVPRSRPVFTNPGHLDVKPASRIVEPQ